MRRPFKKRKYRAWIKLFGEVTSHCVMAHSKPEAAVMVKRDFPDAQIGYITLA